MQEKNNGVQGAKEDRNNLLQVVPKQENNHNGLHQACAACKHQRKKCTETCVLAPYFPSTKSEDFDKVHKYFGVSNVAKRLKIPETYEARRQTAETLIWEAKWREIDPVNGCYGQCKKLIDQINALESENNFFKRKFERLMMYNPPAGFMNWNGSEHIDGYNNCMRYPADYIDNNGNLALPSTPFTNENLALSSGNLSSGNLGRPAMTFSNGNMTLPSSIYNNGNGNMAMLAMKMPSSPYNGTTSHVQTSQVGVQVKGSQGFQRASQIQGQLNASQQQEQLNGAQRIEQASEAQGQLKVSQAMEPVPTDGNYFDTDYTAGVKRDKASPDRL